MPAVPAPPDLELIARVLGSDDRGAFAMLVNRHQVMLRGLLRRLCGGERARADDLAQEALLRAYRGLRGYRGGSRFSTWLCRIGFNVFLDDQARRRPEAAALKVPEAFLAPARPDDLERVAALRQLDEALAACAPAERVAVTLMYACGATQQEIAEVLDCPVGTVKTHLARGKEKLRRLLSTDAAGGEDHHDHEDEDEDEDEDNGRVAR